MARISRKSTVSNYYHVMVQGINKEYIFKNDFLKNKYKNLLIKKSKLNKIIIISYCIMSNHVHILIKTENNENLSKMMSQINSSYGKFYNKISNRVGYVFRDRYRAEPIYNINHLQNCIKYIHENPVKAGIVKRCENYLYSSFNDYKTNKVDKKIIEEIYGKDKEYLSKILGDYENYDFIEVGNEFGIQKLENFNTICKEYIDIDFNIERNVYKVSNELKKRSNATNLEIMEFMKIKKTAYYKILKTQKKMNF